MRATIVKQTSPLVGVPCRANCGGKIRAGQSVLYATLPADDYAEDRFAMHTECVASLAAAAPVGAPISAKSRHARRYAQLAAVVADGGNPFAASA